jgi:hypothetical protein
VSNLNHELHIGSSPNAEARVQEGKIIIAKISALKSGMGKNAIMEYVGVCPPRNEIGLLSLTCRPIPDDGGGNLACYNEELASFSDDGKRWFEMNWLYAECYL